MRSADSVKVRQAHDGVRDWFLLDGTGNPNDLQGFDNTRCYFNFKTLMDPFSGLRHGQILGRSMFRELGWIFRWGLQIGPREISKTKEGFWGSLNETVMCEQDWVGEDIPRRVKDGEVLEEGLHPRGISLVTHSSSTSPPLSHGFLIGMKLLIPIAEPLSSRRLVSLYLR